MGWQDGPPEAVFVEARIYGGVPEEPIDGACLLEAILDGIECWHRISEYGPVMDGDDTRWMARIRWRAACDGD